MEGEVVRLVLLFINNKAKVSCSPITVHFKLVLTLLPRFLNCHSLCFCNYQISKQTYIHTPCNNVQLIPLTKLKYYVVNRVAI